MDPCFRDLAGVRREAHSATSIATVREEKAEIRLRVHSQRGISVKVGNEQRSSRRLLEVNVKATLGVEAEITVLDLDLGTKVLLPQMEDPGMGGGVRLIKADSEGSKVRAQEARRQNYPLQRQHSTNLHKMFIFKKSIQPSSLKI